jgi:hypothetical protein
MSAEEVTFEKATGELERLEKDLKTHEAACKSSEACSE